MPRILCPECDATLAIDDSSVGQMVQCGSCQEVFKATATSSSKGTRARDDEERPRKRKMSSRRDVDEDEDERPSKRKRTEREDDDDDERRRKKKRRSKRGDDDFDDEPFAKASNGMATASLVLGIIALVMELFSFVGSIFGTACCVFCGVLFWPGHGIAGVLAIIGVILGILAMKKPGGKGAWMAGLILCGITLLLGVLVIFLHILGFAAIAAMPTQPPQPGFNQPAQPGFNQPFQPQPIKPRR